MQLYAWALVELIGKQGVIAVVFSGENVYRPKPACVTVYGPERYRICLILQNRLAIDCTDLPGGDHPRARGVAIEMIPQVSQIIRYGKFYGGVGLISRTTADL
jgi:hypothetical protein